MALTACAGRISRAFPITGRRLTRAAAAAAAAWFPWQRVGVATVARVCVSRHGALLVSAIPFVSFFIADKQAEPAHITTIKRAMLAVQRDEPEVAERLLHVALGAASACGDRPAVTRCYSQLAALAVQRRQWRKAERLLVTLAHRYGAQYGLEHLGFLGVSVRLAETYAAQGRCEEARAGLRYCVDVLERRQCEGSSSSSSSDSSSSDSSSSSSATTTATSSSSSSCEEDSADSCEEDSVDCLALLGLASERLARLTVEHTTSAATDAPPCGRCPHQPRLARPLLQRALQLRQQLCGPQDGEALRLQNDLAAVELMCGDCDAAERTFRRTLQLAEQQLPASCQLVATCLVNMGRLQLAAGRLVAAEDQCRRAASVAGDCRDGHQCRLMAQQCLSDVSRATTSTSTTSPSSSTSSSSS